MTKLVTPFRVGLLVLMSGAFLFTFLTFTKKGGMSDREALSVHAYFRDASGLGQKSRVQIAGIAVGEISEIKLEGTRAKVFLKIRRDVGLRVDASLTKRSESLLGDYLLDLNPGSPEAAAMPEGGEITRVIDAQGMEQLFQSLEGITGDIKQVTAALAETLGGDEGTQSLKTIVANMVSLSNEVERTVRANSARLDSILEDAEGVASDVRGITSRQDENVERIVVNVRDATEDARKLLASIQQMVGTNEGDLKDSVSGLKDSLARINKSLDNIEQITTKVRDGKGVAGALLTDERIGQKLSETVDDVADFAQRFTRTQTEIGLRTEFLVNQASAKNTISLRLIPKPDKYYLIELVDDPRGTLETEVIQRNQPGAGEQAYQTIRRRTEALKFTVQAAKRFYFTTLRFGLTENTGGVGTDFHFFDDTFQVKLDAFNFSVERLRYPRLRATARYTAFNHLALTAGLDDILNREDRDPADNRLLSGRDFFVGAGIYFTDDDLKALLPVLPSP